MQAESAQPKATLMSLPYEVLKQILKEFLAFPHLLAVNDENSSFAHPMHRALSQRFGRDSKTNGRLSALSASDRHPQG
jgi:hypothetical protein